MEVRICTDSVDILTPDDHLSHAITLYVVD